MCCFIGLVAVCLDCLLLRLVAGWLVVCVVIAFGYCL